LKKTSGTTLFDLLHVEDPPDLPEEPKLEEGTATLIFSDVADINAVGELVATEAIELMVANHPIESLDDLVFTNLTDLPVDTTRISDVHSELKEPTLKVRFKDMVITGVSKVVARWMK